MEDAVVKQTRRCPRLGHAIELAYCLEADLGAVCSRMLDCWWEIFDVAAWLQTRLSPTDWQRLGAARPPVSKVASLIEQIAQARARLT